MIQDLLNVTYQVIQNFLLAAKLEFYACCKHKDLILHQVYGPFNRHACFTTSKVDVIATKIIKMRK